MDDLNLDNEIAGAILDASKKQQQRKRKEPSTKTNPPSTSKKSICYKPKPNPADQVKQILQPSDVGTCFILDPITENVENIFNDYIPDDYEPSQTVAGQSEVPASNVQASVHLGSLPPPFQDLQNALKKFGPNSSFRDAIDLTGQFFNKCLLECHAVIGKINSENTDLKKKMNSTNAEYNKLKFDHDKEIKEWKEKYEALERSKDTLSASNKELTKSNTNLRKVKFELQQRIMGLEKNREDLQCQLSEKAQLISLHEESISKLNNRCSHLVQKAVEVAGQGFLQCGFELLNKYGSQFPGLDERIKTLKLNSLCGHFTSHLPHQAPIDSDNQFMFPPYNLKMLVDRNMDINSLPQEHVEYSRKLDEDLMKTLEEETMREEEQEEEEDEEVGENFDRTEDDKGHDEDRNDEGGGAKGDHSVQDNESSHDKGHLEDGNGHDEDRNSEGDGTKGDHPVQDHETSHDNATDDHDHNAAHNEETQKSGDPKGDKELSSHDHSNSKGTVVVIQDHQDHTLDNSGADEQQKQSEPEVQNEPSTNDNFQMDMPTPPALYMIPHNQLEEGHAMMHPYIMGVLPRVVPLPTDAVEEPVFVNARQYRGILRRRESRAKDDSANELIKCRKPYLHESRHLHAVNRERGCGGRFLNSKSKIAAAERKEDDREARSQNTQTAENNENGCPEEEGLQKVAATCQPKSIESEASDASVAS